MEKKLNRNARRSIRLIEQSFLELVMEEPYEKVTVTQIVKRADLNRGTFYSHFKDVDDLAGRVIDSFADQIFELIEPMLDIDFYKNPTPLLNELGTFVADHRDLIQKLTTPEGNNALFSSLLTKTRAKIQKEVEATEPERALESMVGCDYLSAGLVWTFHTWAIGAFGDTDIQEIVDHLASLVAATSGAWKHDVLA